MSTGSPGSRNDDELLEACAHAGLRDAAIDLLGAASADPPGGVPLAERLGVTAHHFIDDDLRHVWMALDLTRGDGRDATVRLAAMALKSLGYWDRSQIGGNLGSMRWSAASLGALLDQYPCGTVGVPAAAQRLINLEVRWHEAQVVGQRYRDLKRQYTQVLQSFDRPQPRPPQAPPRMEPTTRRAPCVGAKVFERRILLPARGQGGVARVA